MTETIAPIADRQRDIVEALQGYVLKMVEDDKDPLSVQSAVSSLSQALAHLSTLEDQQ